MAEEHEQSGSAAEVDDSFEAFLKKAAHVSGPAVASLRLQLRPGSTLLDGRLRIVRRIGEGGMGVVYEAFDARRRGAVALKTLNRLDATNVYRLKNEFRSLSEVSHAGLCHLHELFSEAGQWFFTMELIDGERFDKWVRPNGVCDEARLRAALPQLCEGIAAIHAAGKLHRDLKPSNVLVTPDGRVVVLDFGLAVDPELGGVGQTVMDESVSGTPAYMAPEQAAGAAATAASDFYALGVMLFEALTGKLPFDGRVHDLIVDKQRNDAAGVTTLLPQAPVDLATVCDALLSRVPLKRPDAEILRAQWGLPDASPTDSFRRSGVAPRGSEDNLAPDAAPELLGRDAELQALREAFATSVAGQAVVLFVSGESGMGKSALVTHFLDELRAQAKATVLAGRCYERENVPFKGFDSLVDDLSRHLRRQSHAEASALMPREVFALARVFPVLDRIEAVAQAPKKEIPDPHELKRRAFEAFGELLGRMRDRHPLVAFIDDVQWLDQDSVRFMRTMLLHPHPVPLLVVCAHRSEGMAGNPLLQSVLEAAGDNAALRLLTLPVGPLPASALVALAARLLPSGAPPGDAQAFADEARGSPFFAAELARAAQLREPGAALPSLAEAIALHVSALPLSAQRLLSLLALAGQPLSPALAIEAVGLSDGHTQLDRLRSEQLLRVSIDADGERSVECYHDKIREHVAGALDALSVRELSLGLSRALLAQTHSDAELLARCLQLAGMPEEAAIHSARAAEAAFSALAFEHSVQLYAHALSYGRFEPARVQALRLGQARALAYAGLGERAAEAYLEAAKSADGDDAARELTRMAAEQYLLCGNLERGRVVLRKVLRAVGVALPQSLLATLVSVVFWRTRLRLRGMSFKPRTEHDPSTLRRLDALRTATQGLVRSDQVRAVGLCARWVLCALQAGHTVELARALSYELLFTYLMGAPAARVAEADALCTRLCDQTGDTDAQLVLCFSRGCLNLDVAPEQTRVDLERGLELSRANPGSTSSYDAAWLQVVWVRCLMSLGRFTELLELTQGLLNAALARGDHTVSVVLVQPLCWALLAADRPEQAERIVKQGETQLRQSEVTIQDLYVCDVRALPALYAGRALEGWRAAAPLYERFMNSLQGRMMRTQVFGAARAAGRIAVTAARQTPDPAERSRLLAEATRLLKRARRSRDALTSMSTEGVLACLRGDREAVVASLRASLDLPTSPINAQLVRYQLGELLGCAEGQALVAEAHAFLRAGGVVDPARFVAAVRPGIELA